MKKATRLLMVIPLLVMIFLYLTVERLWAYEQPQAWKVLLSVTVYLLPLLVFAFRDAWRYPQKGLWAFCFRASFYGYGLIVILLTLPFVDFTDIVFSSAAWRENILSLQNNYSINLQPFRIYDDYGTLFHRQILGNFVMLLPLGIYLPALYPKLRKFWLTALVGLVTAVSIELLQLLFTHVIPFTNPPMMRSVDLDDVILNTLGAIIGYLFYRGAQSKKRA